MKLTTKIQKEAEKKFDDSKADARYSYAIAKAKELGFSSPENMMKALGFREFRKVMKNAPSVI